MVLRPLVRGGQMSTSLTPSSSVSPSVSGSLTTGSPRPIVGRRRRVRQEGWEVESWWVGPDLRCLPGVTGV